MKYIRNREQYLLDQRIVEEATDQLYDGTWEDTFIGKFFSFIGRKIVHKMKKGKLNKLLEQLQRELEKSQFKTIEEEPVAQRYDVYQNIVLIKSYLKNTGEFSKEELMGFLEEAYKHHTDQSENEKLPTEVRNAHSKVKDGFKEVIDYSSTLVQESLSFDERIKMLLENTDTDTYSVQTVDLLNDLFHNFINAPLRKGGTDTLMTVDIGTEGRYDQYRDLIRGKMREFRQYLGEIPYGDLDNEDLATQIDNFYNYIGTSGTAERGKMNWDNPGALRSSLVKARKEMESIADQLENTVDKEEADKVQEEPSKERLQDADQYRRDMEDKMDEVFPNDQEYKTEMTISKEEMEDLHKTLASKVEDQKNVVDPIAILRIFNRAHNAMSITKDEYDQLTTRYSPKVGSRKKARYELVGETARDKKLFREWNDGVLALLQQYGDYISKHTKKFIITMLDDNKLFGNRGAQAVLLSEYFDVPLEDAKSKLKDTDRPGEHRARLTEDDVVKFSSVNNVEMNSDKIRRVPFILEVVNEEGERKKMSVFPLTAHKGKDSSSLSVKFASGDDYGFIKNYMAGVNVELDTGNLEEMGMVDSDESPVFSGDFLSDNGFLEKGNKYKMTKIHRVSDDKGFEDTRVQIDKIYMLLGAQDEGLYRLPSLNDEMKKAINDSPHDKLI